ncbi:MAG: transglutaminase-like domain-containing protein [Symbiobacteriia bacterium]
MAQLTEAEIKALITLLADEDERTFSVARRVLLEARKTTLPYLESATHSSDAAVRGRVRTLLDSIRLDGLEERFRQLLTETDPLRELETGCQLLAEYAFPDVDMARYGDQLSVMAQELEELLRGRRDARSAVPILVRFLAEEKNLHGDDRYFQDPDGSYLNRVLDRGVGIPISLSIVYLLVAQRLGLPLYGVGLPGHFVVKWEDARDTVYLDPYHGGKTLTVEECRRLVEEGGHPFRDTHLRAVTPRQMLARLMTNLIWIYEQAGEAVAARQVARFRSILLSGRRRTANTGA